MTNGFYDMSTITDTDALRHFFKDAIRLSYRVECQSKYTKQNPNSRGTDTTLTIGWFLDEHIKVSDVDNMRVVSCIDRTQYSPSVYTDPQYCGEVLFSNDFDAMLYCFMNLNNLNTLVNKYGLQLKQW